MSPENREAARDGAAAQIADERNESSTSADALPAHGGRASTRKVLVENATDPRFPGPLGPYLLRIPSSHPRTWGACPTYSERFEDEWDRAAKIELLEAALSVEAKDFPGLTCDDVPDRPGGLEEYVAACPACSGARFSFLLQMDGEHQPAVRCLDGCSVEAISDAVEAQLPERLARVEERWIERLARERQEKEAKELELLLEAGSLRQVAAEAPPVEAIIDGAAYARNIVLKFGSRGARKTFDLVHKSVCIAAGIPWFGRHVKQGRALLVLQEGDHGQLSDWIDRMARGLGTGIEALERSLMIYPKQLLVDVDDSWSQFEYYTRAIGAAFVGIDNLTRVRARATGNAGNDVALNAAIMGRVESLARSGPAVELLHHSNAKGDPLGSQVPANVADLEFVLRAASAKPEALITMRLGAKNRPNSDLDQIKFRFRDREDGALVPEEVGAKPSDEPEPPPADPRLEEMLALLEATPLNTRGLVRELGWHSGTVKKIRDSLEEVGQIERAADGLWRVS